VGNVAQTQPVNENKMKLHPQHHSLGAGSVLSPKGSMTNPLSMA